MSEMLIAGLMFGAMGGILLGLLAGHLLVPKRWRFLMKYTKKGGELAIVADTSRRRVNILPVSDERTDIVVVQGKKGILSKDNGTKMRYEKRASPYRFGNAVAHFCADFHGATLDPEIAAGATAMEGVLTPLGPEGRQLDPRQVQTFPEGTKLNGGEAKIGEGVLLVPVSDGKGGVAAMIAGARAQIAGAVTYDMRDIVNYLVASVPAVELQRFAALAEAAARHDLNKEGFKWMGPLVMVMSFGIVAFILYEIFTGAIHVPGVGPSGPPIGGR